MLTQPVASATQNKFAVDIRRFPWIRRLASDYAFDFGRLADFFSGNPSDPAAWRDAIARSQRYTRQRERVASLIRAQQERRGAPPEALLNELTFKVKSQLKEEDFPPQDCTAAVIDVDTQLKIVS